MNKRFFIKEIHICPVYKEGKNFRPDMEYPTRNCVIDEEKQIAIDIKTKLKYDYIETKSHLYFLSQASKKIKGDNRVAIFPYASILYTGYDQNEAIEIIEKLKNNEDFQDGNEVYGNEQYLEYLKQEREIEQEEYQNNHPKTKKIGKRKK